MRQCTRPHRNAFAMHAAPIVPSATVQTPVRQLLLNVGVAVTAIAIAGSQNTRKVSHGLERISRDLHVVVPDSIGLTLYTNLHSTPGAGNGSAEWLDTQ